ncbi:MAG: ABC transporter ATP-binding protein, partial [Deltaproteobacteria bacterium]|nr:ABC transporter ATP-binding protein [Deltaproteobacteria bacterium]
NGVQVLKGINFKVDTGEILALMGKSGHGKSVLLKHIVGILKPDRGNILIDGEDIVTSRGTALERLRSKLGYLFQGGALFDSINVFENVAFPLREKTSLPNEKIREKVLQELEQVGLPGVENKYPAELSGGMKKRVALARCLCTDPEIMLFDEPTTGLDTVTARSINNLIKETHDRIKFTGVMITHDINQVLSIVQKIAVLDAGTIEFTGTPEEIRATTDPIVRQFFNNNA